jgi:hypothetical protein
MEYTIPALVSNVRQKLLQFKYDDNKLRDKLRTWNCLQSHIPRNTATDCVANSLHFMDIITDRKVAEEYAKHLALTKGARYPDIESQMFTYFINQHGFSEHNRDKTNSMKWIDILNRDLKIEHITMVLLRNNIGDGHDSLGHAVVVYKDKKKQLHLIDAQQQTFMSTDTAISNYFNVGNRYIKMILMQTSNKRIRAVSTIRKQKSPNTRQSKRTRRSRSPSAMSISPELVILPNNKRETLKIRKRKRETLKIRKNKRSESPLTKKARSK